MMGEKNCSQIDRRSAANAQARRSQSYLPVLRERIKKLARTGGDEITPTRRRASYLIAMLRPRMRLGGNLLVGTGMSHAPGPLFFRREGVYSLPGESRRLAL